LVSLNKQNFQLSSIEAKNDAIDRENGLKSRQQGFQNRY